MAGFSWRWDRHGMRLQNCSSVMRSKGARSEIRGVKIRSSEVREAKVGKSEVEDCGIEMSRVLTKS